MNLTRRTFVGWGTLLFSGAAFGFTGLMSRKAGAEVFGSLVPDPDGILDLPEGFSYTILKTQGDLLSDGTNMRTLHDGMAAFAGENPDEVILLLNHEVGGGGGGVSRLVVDTRTLEVISGNQVLTGTTRNCAGGPSPWGWLSCEETGTGGVWVCPTDATEALESPLRVDDYGSFSHEAVCIDPDTLIAYLTEDDGDSHLYRMVPTNAAADPFTGQLQALKVVGQNDYSTRASNMNVGDEVDIEWVNVNPGAARASAKSAGAAIFHRGEGIWWFDGSVYFTATTDHQIFELVPSGNGGKLRLISVGDTVMPDNITVAPWGDLFVAEDAGGGHHCRLQVIDVEGNVSSFARNAESANAELAGVCFSPDGKILFVNMQGQGRTLAIVGPFPVPEEPGGNTGGAGTGGAAAAGGSSGGSDSSSSGGATDAGGSGSGGGPSDPTDGEEGGCGCAIAGGVTSTGSTLVLAGTAGAAWLRRSGRAEAEAAPRSPEPPELPED